MIPAPHLEIDVLVIGMLLLLLEAFAPKISGKISPYVAILGLVAVLGATFFLAPAPAGDHTTGFWSFYAADPLSIFFKRFALITTILVLIMMIDYAPVLRTLSGPGAGQSALGR